MVKTVTLVTMKCVSEYYEGTDGNFHCNNETSLIIINFYDLNFKSVCMCMQLLEWKKYIEK